jgi:phage terminase small subunit
MEKFCVLYAADPEGNGTRAAEGAGYSKKTAASQASRLLKRPDVRERVQAIRADIVDELGLTAAHMTQRLNEIYMRCMTAKAVMEWDWASKSYVPTGIFQFDSRGAAKAVEMIARLGGLMTDKVEHSGGIVLEVAEDVRESGR